MAPSKGPNPLLHIINRQTGDNVYNFRMNLIKERLKVAKNLYSRNLVSHFGCVNAIEFSKEGELLVSGGDDRRVLLWNIEKSIANKEAPIAMEKQHNSNIFCLALNNDNKKIISGGNDCLVVVHNVQTGELIDTFPHEKPVYGLSIDPLNDQIFSTAGEDGRVIIFDMRSSSEVLCVARYRGSFQAVMFHPISTDYIVAANAIEGAAFWDLRWPKTPLIRYGGEDEIKTCMNARFNDLGTQVLCIRRRLPPILYHTTSSEPICQFYHPEYYNSCTMKSCCFGGDNDEYILSGSDDFNLYLWRLSDVDLNKNYQFIETNQMTLYGHRSIVNQVRYNKQKSIIASSGVEKIIKLWTPFSMDGWSGSLLNEPEAPNITRNIFTNYDYDTIYDSLTNDYSNQNTHEDAGMMGFFDALVQRDIETWNNENECDSEKSSEHTTEHSSRSSSSDSERSIEFFQTPHMQFRRSNLSIANIIKPQRPKYRNRIAYLIATKRSLLKRLAIKGSLLSLRHSNAYNRYGTRKTKRNQFRSCSRKMIGKRGGRIINMKKINKRRVSSDEQNSDYNVPRKVTKRRIQQHLNTSSYRTFRRKVSKLTPCRIQTSESSTDDEHQNDRINQNNIPSTSTSASTSTNQQNINENTTTEQAIPSTTSCTGSANTSNNNNIAIPSTSTGITVNGQDLKLITNVETDDDQLYENNSLNNELITENLFRTISPSFLYNRFVNYNSSSNGNGKLTSGYNDADVNNGKEEVAHTVNGHNNNIREDDDDDDDDDVDDDINKNERNYRYTHPKININSNRCNNQLLLSNFDAYSSHSNSRLSNSSCQDDDVDDDDIDYINPLHTKTASPTIASTIVSSHSTLMNNPNIDNFNNCNSNDNNRAYYNNTPDSGIIMHQSNYSAGSNSFNTIEPSSSNNGSNMSRISNLSILTSTPSSINSQPSASHNNENLINYFNQDNNNINHQSAEFKLFEEKLERCKSNYNKNFNKTNEQNE